MSGSILNPVRTAVIAVIAADATFAAGQARVSFQYPVKDRRRINVWTSAGQRRYESASMRTGRNFRNEDAQFDVNLSVEGVGLTVEDTAALADTYLARIEELISDRKNGTDAAWSSCPGLIWVAIEGEGKQSEFYNDTSHIVEASIPVKFSARLT
jgi:hypothetical protein